MDIIQIAIDNKDVFTTIVVVWLIVWVFIPVWKNELKQIRELLKVQAWRVIISKEQTLSIVKKSMLSWSYKKLDYIEKRLNKNNLKERRDIIKRQIRTELIKLSDEEYLNFLDTFCYNWFRVWDLIRKHFSFDEFIEEVFDCIFDERVDTQLKLKNIMEVMRVYQSECVSRINNIN